MCVRAYKFRAGNVNSVTLSNKFTMSYGAYVLVSTSIIAHVLYSSTLGMHRYVLYVHSTTHVVLI